MPQGRTHYDRVREYYRTHECRRLRRLAATTTAPSDQLTDLFYKGDRSMRESGFDPSNRFGPFSVDIIHYTPVCLNSLLYRMEAGGGRDRDDLSATTAGRSRWRARERAPDRAHRTGSSGTQRAGLYFDYNFADASRRPLRVRHDLLSALGGPAPPASRRAACARTCRGSKRQADCSPAREVTGSQWDAPFGWAPLQMIAVEGLRRYGYEEDADRLARKFVALVVKEFEEHGTIVEKYDVRRRESDVGPASGSATRPIRLASAGPTPRLSGAHGGPRSPPTVEGAWRSGPLRAWPMIRRRGLTFRHRLRSGYPRAIRLRAAQMRRRRAAASIPALVPARPPASPTPQMAARRASPTSDSASPHPQAAIAATASAVGSSARSRTWSTDPTMWNVMWSRTSAGHPPNPARSARGR